MHSHKIKQVSLSVIAAIGVTLAGVGLANADTFGLQAHKVTGSENAIRAINNSVSLAVTGTLMNYQEHINPGPSDTESGWMPGFRVAGSYMGQDHVYLHLSYQYSHNGIHYDGANLETHAPVYTTDHATTQRFLAKVGYGFWFGPNMAVTPYVAAGYQSWHRNLQIPVGQEVEDYSTTLAGVGALFQYHAMPRLILSADAEMLAVTGGGMTPHITGLDLPSAHFKTSGEESLALDANYRISGPWSAFGGMSFTHFNYTGGGMGADYMEPSSSTNQFGLDAGVRYAF